ncbi:hypothetical protein DFH27DRAFT_127434 [Peziza echinospora]|nr:hypothetical protein DFH27DRAFT_127434 [Peziza echinospora]
MITLITNAMWGNYHRRHNHILVHNDHLFLPLLMANFISGTFPFPLDSNTNTPTLDIDYSLLVTRASAVSQPGNKSPPTNNANTTVTVSQPRTKSPPTNNANTTVTVIVTILVIAIVFGIGLTIMCCKREKHSHSQAIISEKIFDEKPKRARSRSKSKTRGEGGRGGKGTRRSASHHAVGHRSSNRTHGHGSTRVGRSSRRAERDRRRQGQQLSIEDLANYAPELWSNVDIGGHDEEVAIGGVYTAEVTRIRHAGRGSVTLIDTGSTSVLNLIPSAPSSTTLPQHLAHPRRPGRSRSRSRLRGRSAGSTATEVPPPAFPPGALLSAGGYTPLHSNPPTDPFRRPRAPSPPPTPEQAAQAAAAAAPAIRVQSPPPPSTSPTNNNNRDSASTGTTELPRYEEHSQHIRIPDSQVQRLTSTPDGGTIHIDQPVPSQLTTPARPQEALTREHLRGGGGSVSNTRVSEPPPPPTTAHTSSRTRRREQRERERRESGRESGRESTDTLLAPPPRHSTGRRPRIRGTEVRATVERIESPAPPEYCFDLRMDPGSGTAAAEASGGSGGSRSNTPAPPPPPPTPPPPPPVAGPSSSRRSRRIAGNDT